MVVFALPWFFLCPHKPRRSAPARRIIGIAISDINSHAWIRDGFIFSQEGAPRKLRIVPMNTQTSVLEPWFLSFISTSRSFVEVQARALGKIIISRHTTRGHPIFVKSQSPETRFARPSAILGDKVDATNRAISTGVSCNVEHSMGWFIRVWRPGVLLKGSSYR